MYLRKLNVDIIWFAGLLPEELKTPWETPDLPPIVIIGNLPFNISTPLVIKYLKLMQQRKNIFSYGRVPCTFTFQDEVSGG